MRGLNYRERYHTQELLPFYFIFVANFIRDKNPLYGIYTTLGTLKICPNLKVTILNCYIVTDADCDCERLF